MWTYSKPSSGTSDEGESVFYEKRAVVDPAIETGLIPDDEKDGSGEESGDEADVNAGYDEEDSDRNAVGRAFEISQPDTSDTMDVTEQTVVIGAFQRLLSETEPDPDSGDESVEEPKDVRECDGPLVPRDPSDVNLIKPGDRREESESLSSDSDYGQFSDDDYVEPVRPQQDDDGSSDDEGPPIMDAPFIESLGGTLPLNQMDKNALRSLKWGATSSVFGGETSTFRGLVQETAHPIPALRAKKDSPLDLMFYFLPKSL
ncbi:hypothetical protein PInf_007633 [Phytophthora infestans]|nr:hypothetical protein PInf_007633 [Phytophthora infestans]